MICAAMSSRPARVRKPSSKLAFLDAHSADWEEHQQHLDETKSDRKRKRSNAKKNTKKSSRGSNTASRKRGRTGPKRPLSAYVFFQRETRAEVLEDFPDATFGQVAQILGEWWRDCSAAERRKFENMAAKDKIRYQQELSGGTYVPPKSKKTKSKARAPAAKMSYLDMIKDAIRTLKNRKGSSAIAIEKFILENHLDEDSFKRHHLRRALNTNSQNGNLVKVRGSYKVPRN